MLNSSWSPPAFFPASLTLISIYTRAFSFCLRALQLMLTRQKLARAHHALLYSPWLGLKGRSQLQREHQGMFSVYSTIFLNMATAFGVTCNTFQINSQRWRKSNGAIHLQKLSKTPNVVTLSSELLQFTYLNTVVNMKLGWGNPLLSGGVETFGELYPWKWPLPLEQRALWSINCKEKEERKGFRWWSNSLVLSNQSTKKLKKKHIPERMVT